MEWIEICENPMFNDLPFKIETDESGKIIMSPVKLDHSHFQFNIGVILKNLLPEGHILVECAIKTIKGTKVADTVWFSPERWRINKGLAEADKAPEICIEVWSESNTKSEIEEKIMLYLSAGAMEVWICRDGNFTFYNATGQIDRSELAPEFPKTIDV